MATQGRGSRRKGGVGEREVVKAFRAAGWSDAKRAPGSENQVDGDLHNVPGYNEVRFRETLLIPAWIRECIEKAGHDRWALIFRRSREPWSVAISLDRYLRLLALEEDANG